MGGAIGTSVFITMALWLPRGGPAGLLIGYFIWCCNVWCINECFAEMTCFAPVPQAFITATSYWFDEAFAFAQVWAFFLCQVLLVPAEITAFHVLITFWTDKIPVEATVIVVLIAYAGLNCFSVEWFGKAEFYLSIFKVGLMLMMFAFTFFTMIGVNPINDAYGFRYWKDPGPFAEYLTNGSLGSFWGFLSCMSLASFAVVGPEYIASVAAETKTPRRIMPACFKSFKWRLGLFFVGSAICLGTVVPSNDATLLAFVNGAAEKTGTGASVPYVIAMERLEISGLPHLVNAIIMTSVFSCGNGVLFAAARALFVMGKDGRAPRVFAKTTKRGIPIYSVSMCLLVGLLAMMQVSSAAAEVLHYFIDLCTVCEMIVYAITCVTYLHFYKACKLQGISRDSLPYKAKFQPYAACIGVTMTTLMMFLLGFDIISPFSIKWFFLEYTLVGVFPIAVLGWKFWKKTKWHHPHEADLTLGGAVKEVDEYEELVQPESEGWVEKAFSGVWEWRDLVGVVRRRKK